jgi:hypothetical protein
MNWMKPTRNKFARTLMALVSVGLFITLPTSAAHAREGTDADTISTSCYNLRDWDETGAEWLPSADPDGDDAWALSWADGEPRARAEFNAYGNWLSVEDTHEDGCYAWASAYSYTGGEFFGRVRADHNGDVKYKHLNVPEGTGVKIRACVSYSPSLSDLIPASCTSWYRAFA